MSDNDIRPALAALWGHLRDHPELVPLTLSVIVDGDSKIRVHAHINPSRLVGLAAWIRTLDDVQPAVVSDNVDRLVTVPGKLPDGAHRVELVAIVSEDDRELIAAQTQFRRGATFPAELLGQLADRQTEPQVTP